MASNSGSSIVEPPKFCEYAGGACDQNSDLSHISDGLFLYPSTPKLIANTIEEGVENISGRLSSQKWNTWKDLGVAGNLVFCEICKAIRLTKVVIADVTTLNFNLLFEIGFSFGLNKPVLPIRDTSYSKDEKTFSELGLFDTLGYLDFQNSQELVDKICINVNNLPPFSQYPPQNTETPLYLVRSNVHSDGMIKLLSSIKKSGLRFRAFDPQETSRLSLHEAFKQVCSSFGVIAHLVDPNRTGALVHNSRCAFLCGMAMAIGKSALMLQESDVSQPIDYRDVVKNYNKPSDIPDLIVPVIKSIFEELQQTKFVPSSLPLRPLEKIDLGDLAAENEIGALRTYFVPTAQFNDAKRGHARLVVGRKGSGKTAIFYGIRSTYRGSEHLVLDMKPEGHQFIKFREVILRDLSPGIRQHVLTAFWNYLLLMEIAYRIIKDDEQHALNSFRRKEAYDKVLAAYGDRGITEEADFSERLLSLVNEILSRRKDIPSISSTAEVTQLIYKQNIHELTEALGNYLIVSRREDVWMLIDNLDKGWPVTLATSEDILILRCLLEATRKLQRQFEKLEVAFNSVVFVRNDIYQHLVLNPADRGKDTAVVLEWNDVDVFKEILRRRIVSSTLIDQPFDAIWQHFFDTHVHGIESFSYIIERTQMRPRELLHFTRECINIAVNRAHEKVLQEDITKAEESFSEDMLVEVNYELKDINPYYVDLPYAFIGCNVILTRKEVEKILTELGMPPENHAEAISLLLWFGFLGIRINEDEERYSYQYQHDNKLMTAGLVDYFFCIHPGFRYALGCLDY
jgi:hypothetical protein